MATEHFFEHIVSYSKGLALTLLVWIFVLGVGLVLDLDHVLVLALKGIPITPINLAIQAARPLHLAVMVIAVSITCIYLSCLDRLWACN